LPERMKVTIFPFQLDEVARLDDRLSKLRPSAILEKDRGEPHDVVDISTKVKRRQVLGLTRSEVLEHIRNTR
jgi:hypothetical protein